MKQTKHLDFTPLVISLIVVLILLSSCGVGRSGYGCPSSRKLGDTDKPMKY